MLDDITYTPGFMPGDRVISIYPCIDCGGILTPDESVICDVCIDLIDEVDEAEEDGEGEWS